MEHVPDQLGAVSSEAGGQEGDAELSSLAVSQSAWRTLLRSIVRNAPAVFGAVVILVLVLVAVFAPQIAPYDPNQGFADGLSRRGGPLPPNARFLLGTDPNGRDVLSRLIFGSRVSLTIGVVANGIAMAIGVVVGMVSGFYGGWVEVVLMRFTDIVMSFPLLIFAIALIAVTGPSELNIILVLALIYWTTVARVVHGMVLSLKEREFVTACRTLGLSSARILVRHILPHLVSAIIVYGSLGVAVTILVEASLSYIGIGVPVPQASWGQMIATGQSMFREAPWLMLFPGIALLLTVLAFNLLGDWLRDELDPIQEKR